MVSAKVKAFKPASSSFQYRQLCNFVHHQRKQTGKRRKGTWETSFGESWAQSDFEDFTVVANEVVDAGDEEAKEGGVHPQEEADGLADNTAAV